MIVIRSNEGYLSGDKYQYNRSIFLAGPTYRDSELIRTCSWRNEAINILSSFQDTEDLLVFAPEPFAKDYQEQLRWEYFHLEAAKVILFWIPRDLELLPGFTTNVEFGEWLHSGKIILGFPTDTPKIRYLEHRAYQHNVPVFKALTPALKLSVGLSTVNDRRYEA